VSAVSTDADRVAKLFPALGPVTGAHWQSREARPRTCPDIGPMDYVYEGIVTLAAPIDRSRYVWQPASLSIAAALSAYAPPNAQWRESRDFNDAIAPSARFYLDDGSDTVYFVSTTS
jgi:hypothetical protein